MDLPLDFEASPSCQVIAEAIAGLAGRLAWMDGRYAGRTNGKEAKKQTSEFYPNYLFDVDDEVMSLTIAGRIQISHAPPRNRQPAQRAQILPPASSMKSCQKRHKCGFSSNHFLNPMVKTTM